MKKFQYLVITIDNASDAYLTEFLDKHGEQGWELVSIRQTLRQEMLVFTFKMEQPPPNH